MIDSVTKGIADVLFETLDSQKKTTIMTIVDFSDGETINNVCGTGHDIQTVAIMQLLILAGRMPEAKRDDFLKAAKASWKISKKKVGMIGMSRTMAVCGTKTKAAGCVEQPAAGESHSGRGFTSSIAREV